MATLVLSTVGSALGGPLGLAAGAFIGRQIDSAVFGGNTRQGPRLKELAVTTSSYGQPIQRNFGRMRVAGTVIWATDLVEQSSKEGGKGQPSTTVYTYSVSFAVALSSTPIARLGRIWADGNLLRGANEDLKVEGALRVYLGKGDDPVDPSIAADQAGLAPAFRDSAYVVFEDLQLADYGNRIPALTFEVFAEDDLQVALGQIAPQANSSAQSQSIKHARGFADEGGAVMSSLASIDQVVPLYCVTEEDGFSLSSEPLSSGPIPTLPAQLASISDNPSEDRTKQRADDPARTPLALRYYDEQRDYQPGVQRALGLRPNGRENVIDLPATMTSDGARRLANANAQRARWHHERITWRVAQLDPSIQPGSIVRLPDTAGRWIVRSWEWFDRGIELGLERAPPSIGAPTASEPGLLIPPQDLPIAETVLDFIETPFDGQGSSTLPMLFAAASSDTGRWHGASLYSDQGSSLVPIGSTDSRRALVGTLVSSVPASTSLVFEPDSELVVHLPNDALAFEPADLRDLASGFNRLLVGDELLQFADAGRIDEQTWRLSGLLRGRAGTEAEAAIGHSEGTPTVLLDDRLTALDTGLVTSSSTSRIAAIGRGDQNPVFATLRNAGLSRRPLHPVHPRIRIEEDLGWTLCWTRRARGQWIWEDRVDVPLVEEQERYLVGFGPTDAPHQTWQVTTPEITLSQSERGGLIAQYGSGPVWVKQVGTFDHSLAVHIAEFTQ